MGKMQPRGIRSLTRGHIKPIPLEVHADPMASWYNADPGSVGLGWCLGFYISSKLLGDAVGPGTAF